MQHREVIPELHSSHCPTHVHLRQNSNHRCESTSLWMLHMGCRFRCVRFSFFVPTLMYADPFLSLFLFFSFFFIAITPTAQRQIKPPSDSRTRLMNCMPSRLSAPAPTPTQLATAKPNSGSPNQPADKFCPSTVFRPGQEPTRSAL